MRCARADHRRRAEIPSVPLREDLEAGVAASSRVAHVAHALLRPAAPARDRISGAGTVRDECGLLQLPGERALAAAVPGPAVLCRGRGTNCCRAPQADGDAAVQTP